MAAEPFAAVRWRLPTSRLLVLLLLNCILPTYAKDADDDSSKAKKKKSGVLGNTGPAKWGSSKFWVNIKGMGFSEGRLEPKFNETKTHYKLEIDNGKATQLLLTIQLDTSKYNLLQLPKLVWNGEDMHYSPIETIEFSMMLNKSMGPLQQTATLTCMDPTPSTWLFHPQTKTYFIDIVQAPDIEKIVTAKNIEVWADGHKAFKATPAYNPLSKLNEIIFYVPEDVESVVVKVTCPDEGTGLKYNGILQPTKYAEHHTTPIEGASKAVLAQCIYSNQRWTKNKEMQRTYVVKILRNAELAGTNVSIRIWPPTEGKCLTHTFRLKNGTWQHNFTCMGYHHAVPLLGTFENPRWKTPKAELVVVNLKTTARYRLWNGIPSRVPLSHDTPVYQLRLEAGTHHRIYMFTLKFPPYCSTLDCSKGTDPKYKGNYFRFWSHGSTKFDVCKWAPCNAVDDWHSCCTHKGALCPSYTSCKSSTYRAKHPQSCPSDNNFPYLKYNYNASKWKCPQNQTVVPKNRCEWTPCVESDKNYCCGHTGAEPCSTMKCPMDKVHRANAEGTTCTNNPCSGVEDETKCCTYRSVCTSMVCPDGYSLKYNAALFLCKGEFCKMEDRNTCCDTVMYCDRWTCPPGWQHKKEASIIPCGGYPCLEWDTGICCDMKGMCSTMSCPSGYYKRENAATRPCKGLTTHTCDPVADLDNCCAKAAQCSESYVCTRGYEFKLNVRYLTCPGAECKPTDRNLCCDMVDPFQAARNTQLIPDKGTGVCKMGDGPMSFHCEAYKSELHVIVLYTFGEPVGNQIYMGNQLVQGRTATIDLPTMDVSPSGKRYTFTQWSRIAGRGVVHSKISIWVTMAANHHAASPKTTTKASNASNKTLEGKASNASTKAGARESVLRKLFGEAVAGAACRTESLAAFASMLILTVHVLTC